MPRKRQIKPTIFANEELGAESTDPLILPLFEALWCLADREGRLEDRPQKIVNGFAFPYRNITDPDGMLQWLHDRGFIIRYSVGGKRFLEVVNFKAHQIGGGIHPNEVPSVIPPIPTTYLTDNLGYPHGGTLAHPSSALTSSSSFPSLPSSPSLKNGGPKPPVEKDPIERRIWEDGVDLLVQKAKMKDESARPLLGRLAKQYGEELLAESIAVTLTKNPAEPKAFLIGVLKHRWNQSQPKDVFMKGRAPTAEEQAAFVSQFNCPECFDLGIVVVPSNEIDSVGGVVSVACECGQPPVKL